MADPGISSPGGAVEFLGSRDSFYHPLHVPYFFVARVLKRINYKLYKHCMLTAIKVYAYYTVKIPKNKFKKIINSKGLSVFVNIQELVSGHCPWYCPTDRG